MGVKHVVIKGAGISGACAANEFKKMGYEVTILEKNNYVGGKLKTYQDTSHPGLSAEYGAGVLTHNYPIIDNLLENNIHVEKLLDMRNSTVEVLDELNKLSLFGRLMYSAQFVWQSIKFASSVWTYNVASANLNEKIPSDLEAPFSDYVKTHHLQNVATFLKTLVPGFGYGTYDDEKNYTYKILAYMGYTTLPAIGASYHSLVNVHGGYQQLVEKMLEGCDVKTSVTINRIDRSPESVKVKYIWRNSMGEDIEDEIDADLLVDTTSPATWNTSEMKLSPAEQACADQATFFRYPVAICKIKGLPPEQIFVPSAMEKEGFGHAAFLFTRDNRTNPEDGRLFSVYINLPRGNTTYNLDPGSKDIETLKQDLLNLGATDVTLLDSVVWKDYHTTLPWKTGIKLQKEELTKSYSTIHLGGHMPGSFETVAGCSQYAKYAIQRYFNASESFVSTCYRNAMRTIHFFSMPREKIYSDEQEKQEQCLMQKSVI